MKSPISAVIVSEKHEPDTWGLVLGGFSFPCVEFVSDRHEQAQSDPVPVMAKPIPWLENDQVEAQGQGRDRRPVRQAAEVAEREARRVQARALATVDRFLRQAEVAPRPPAHLDDDQRRRRTRVDHQEVDLVAAHPKMPPEHRPALPLEVGRNLRFGRITGVLGVGSHLWTMPDGGTPPINRRSIAAQSPLTRRLLAPRMLGGSTRHGGAHAGVASGQPIGSEAW